MHSGTDKNAADYRIPIKQNKIDSRLSEGTVTSRNRCNSGEFNDEGSILADALEFLCLKLLCFDVNPRELRRRKDHECAAGKKNLQCSVNGPEAVTIQP